MGRALTQGPVLPGVNHALFIHPDSRSIVHSHSKLINPRRQNHAARPTHGIVIGGQALRRTPRAPIKINGGIIADDNRCAGQERVVEILAAPIGKRGDRFPPKRNLRHPDALIILNLDHMIAAKQVALTDIFSDTSIPPIVDDERAVHIDAHAIIG